MTTTMTDNKCEKITINGYDYRIYRLRPDHYAVNVLPGTFTTKEAALAALTVYVQQSDRAESAGHTPLWYEASTGNHQGLIVEEETGRSIAVVYDKADTARIITAANNHASLVAVLEAAKLLLAMDNCNYDRDQMRRSGGFSQLQEAVNDALSRLRE